MTRSKKEKHQTGLVTFVSLLSLSCLLLSTILTLLSTDGSEYEQCWETCSMLPFAHFNSITTDLLKPLDYAFSSNLPLTLLVKLRCEVQKWLFFLFLTHNICINVDLKLITMNLNFKKIYIYRLTYRLHYEGQK